MKYYQKFFGLVSLIAFIIAASFKQAHAYLDPGTGSFIFQMALAALLAAAVTIKFWWKRIIILVKSLFSRSSKKEVDDK